MNEQRRERELYRQAEQAAETRQYYQLAVDEDELRHGRRRHAAEIACLEAAAAEAAAEENRLRDALLAAEEEWRLRAEAYEQAAYEQEWDADCLAAERREERAAAAVGAERMDRMLWD